MHLFAPVKIIIYSFWLLVWAVSLSGCEKMPQKSVCVKGKVIGQGCLTGSYAIMLEGKNTDYGIEENIVYDNVVETLNLPEEYKTYGTTVYFTFSRPAEEIGKYLTYCSSAPQIIVQNISATACTMSMQAQYIADNPK